jgi:hypothetical protein
LIPFLYTFQSNNEHQTSHNRDTKCIEPDGFGLLVGELLVGNVATRWALGHFTRFWTSTFARFAGWLLEDWKQVEKDERKDND